MFTRPAFFFFFVFILGAMNTGAQLKEKKFSFNKDSLLKVIATSEDSVRIEAYYEIGSNIVKEDTVEGFLYLDRGLELAFKKKRFQKMALILQRKGTAHVVHGSLKASIPYFDSSQKLYLQYAPNDRALVSLYNNFAVAYYMDENNVMALEIYLKGYEVCKNDKTNNNYPTIVNNIGLIYKKLELYDDALHFLHESLLIKKEKNDKAGEANSLFNIGTIYVEKKNIDSSVKYLSSAKKLYLQLNETQDAADADLVLAGLYYQLGNLRKAGSLIEPFVVNGLKNVHKHNLPTAALIVAGVDVKKGLPAQGLQWLTAVDTLDKQFITHKELRDLYYLKADAFSAMGNLKLAALYRDSGMVVERKIYEEKTQRLAQEMQVRMKTSEKEARIELLEAKNKITVLELKESRRRGRIFIIAMMVFAVVSFVFWQLSRKIKYQKKLIEEGAQERERLVAMRSVIEGQEEERGRIAKDLHDGLGGLLSTVKSFFSKLQPGQTPEETAHLNETSKMIDAACVEVRRIAHNMMPHALSLAGLEGALEDIAANLRAAGIACRLEINDMSEDLSETSSAVIYRVIQELMQNIIKHSAATEVLLQVLTIQKKLLITVEDNGKGFDVESVKLVKGLGMDSVASRVKYLNGSLHYDSVPGQGTTVNIEIPL